MHVTEIFICGSFEVEIGNRGKYTGFVAEALFLLLSSSNVGFALGMAFPALF
jgi:hypothetical protein